MLSNSEAIDLLKTLKKDATPEWTRLRRFVRYARGRQRLPWLPDNVESEYTDIAKKSASNWLDLVIRSVVQGLYVDGYTDDEVWGRAWQANGYDARQAALHRATGICGYGFNIVFPAEGGGVWLRPESATRMAARYADPADEWPIAAIRLVSGEINSDAAVWELYDDVARYTIKGREVLAAEHGLGVPPVVQMRWALDLLDTPQGEVEPVIPIQDRIVDATFTLQMVAKYGAFPQRWIAGIKVPEDAEGNPLPPQIKAYVDHILMAADADTKFGQFAAADLRQYVEALEAHIRHLAAITQTPPHYLLGSLVNLSAEALAAAESGLQRKIREKREVLGEGYEQTLRLAAMALGDEEAANDTSSQVHWQDIESRSLAQVADALLKLAQLGVPLQVLLPMIPNLTKTDVDAAIALIESGDGLAALADRLEAGLASVEEEPAA